MDSSGVAPSKDGDSIAIKTPPPRKDEDNTPGPTAALPEPWNGKKAGNPAVDGDNQGFAAGNSSAGTPLTVNDATPRSSIIPPPLRNYADDQKLLGGPGEEFVGSAVGFHKVAALSILGFFGRYDPAGPDILTLDPARKYDSTFPKDCPPLSEERPRNLCHACRRISLDGMRRSRIGEIKFQGHSRTVKLTHGTTHKHYHLIWESAAWCELCNMICQQTYLWEKVKDRHEKWQVILSTFDEEREIRIRVESPWERRTGYLSIYTPEGSHLGSTIRGKKLSTDPLCEDNLKNVRDWLEKCREQHTECNPFMNAMKYGMSLGKGEKPSRLIEIHGEPDKMQARLIDNLGNWRDFVALSYMWAQPREGDSGPFKSTSSNVAENYVSIPLYRLERRLREALAATVILGIRYIWIDALCIVQDDIGDKALEIQKMHHIYGLAVLTLILPRDPGWVFGGDGCITTRNVGFLGMLPPYPNGIPFCNRSDDRFFMRDNERSWMNDKETYYIGPSTQQHGISGGDEQPSFGGWNDRGWTLQERCLSNRAIILGPSRILLICRVSSLREKGLGDWKDVSNPLNRTPYGPTYLGKSSFFLPLTPKLPDWFHLAEDLSARKFTNPMDKADAILGMGLRLQTYWKSNYVRDAGLFWLRVSATAAQLLWCAAPRIRRFAPTDKQEEKNGGKKGQHATWSWLYHDGCVSWRWIMSAGSPSVVLGAAREFLSFQLFPADHVPLHAAAICTDRRRLIIFGQIRRVYVSEKPDFPELAVKTRSAFVKKSADMDVLGQLFRLERKEEDAERRFPEEVGRWTPFGQAVFDGKADGDVFAVNVLVEKYDVEAKDVPTEAFSYVLLVRRLYHAEPIFRRVGVGVIMDQEFFHGRPASCVTVV